MSLHSFRSLTARSVAFDVATVAWVAAVVNGGGSVSGVRETVVNNLIVGLKADGIWTKLDRLWLLAAENATSALVDLVKLSAATVVGTPTFTANSGYAGELAGNPTNYINSNYKENAAGNKFVQNDCHISAWIVTPCVGGYWLGQVGHFDETTSTILDNGTFIHSDVSDNEGNGPSWTYDNNLGHFINVRTASNFSELYHNATSVATAPSLSGPPDANAWAITAMNHNTETIENGTNGIIGMVSAGGALTLTEVGNFYTRLRTYMTAVGVPTPAFGTLLGTFSTAGVSALTSCIAQVSSGSGVVQPGDLVFGVFFEQTNLTISAVADSQGNTYTFTNAGTDAGTSTGRAFYTRVTANGTLTSLTGTATASTDNFVLIAGIFAGPFDLPPVDVNIANTTTGSSGAVYTCPATGTRAQAIELVVGWAVRSSGTAFTATAPNLVAIQLATATVGQAVIGYQTTATAVTISPVFTSAISSGVSVLGTTSFELTQLYGQGCF